MDGGRRRVVGGADLEHLSGEAGGVPVGHGEDSSGFDDAGEFGGGDVGAGGEHGSEHGDDGVEGGVGVGESFGVAFIEGDGEAFGGGAFAGLDEEVGSKVEAGDEASGAGQREGEVSGSGGDVEDVRAGGQVEASDETIGVAGEGFGDDSEVSCHPGIAQGGLDLVEGGCGVGLVVAHGYSEL